MCESVLNHICQSFRKLLHNVGARMKLNASPKKKNIIVYIYIYTHIIEGSLEAKLPTRADAKAQPGRKSDMEKVRREKIRDGEDQRWRKSEERISSWKLKKCQNTSGSDDFWKLRCRKSARRCGAKHIWK